MHTFRGLLRLQLVNRIFGFVPLVRDGQDAQRGDGFIRITRSGVHLAHADGNGITDVNQRNRERNSDEDASGQSANWSQERDSSRS